ncbi:MAG: UDP-glucose 4-epimerase GalE [Candidatus Dependentiae bacterium]|nr:UDP-glucose 4-epimerase GalE [Candidatus Dependentiae bacterium]
MFIIYLILALIGSTMHANNTKPALLITGGAGYIGSHTALLMSEKYQIIILDSLLHEQPFDHPWATLIKADIADTNILHDIFTRYNIQAVMHFAAFIEVGRSVKEPLAFYENNVTKTLKLLEVMLAHNVKNFIFSSSCAVYGIPQSLPLTEIHPKNPISPYGSTKLIVEMALKELNVAHGLNFVALRYFNAAGLLPNVNLGEHHKPETHVIPLLLQAAQSNTPFYIFGDDYPTTDGTCIRDFLHVQDIADAHAKALEYLQAGNKSDFFNLGTGNGYSVRELIDTTEQITNTTIKTIVHQRRAGDPAVLVADPSHALNSLGWKAQYSDLTYIVRTAWENVVLSDHTDQEKEMTR